MSQEEQILKRLSKGWLTPLDALKEIGCFRLAARVFDLRQKGIDVLDKDVVIGGKHFKAYKIARAA